MPFPQFEVEFTKRGQIHDHRQLDSALDAISGLTDLFVLSHGWNNDMRDARLLYENLLKSVDDVIGFGVVPGIAGRNIGVLRIFWPSKKFADDELIPGGGAASATAENDASLSAVLESLKHDPERLGGSEVDPALAGALTRAQELIPALDGDAAARQEFVLQLRSVLDPAEAHADDGSEEFFSRSPEELFAELNEPVQAPIPVGGGGAARVGTEGGAAGLIDGLKGARAAARRIANYATYYRMKDRAGTVGRTGVGPMLQRLRDRNENIRLHLVGHSFGGRLVTAAAATLPANTPGVTMALLQAAFSHNGLAENFDGEKDGFFRTVLAHKRISGPVLITHTKNDRAVGIAYPLASRIARQKAAALGDQNDPYGGMGRNGAQHTSEAAGFAGTMQNVGGAYSFEENRVYNLLADQFIRDHGAVAGPEVAYAFASAASTV